MKPTHRNPLLRNFVLAATISLSFGQATHAASVYWDTNGTTAGSGAATGTWGTNTYWTTTEAGNVATNGTLPTANDDVFIAAAANGTTGTITIATDKVAGSLTLQEPAASPGVIISGGTSLTLGGGTTATKGLFVTGNGTHTVSTPLILNGANTIQTGGTGLLTINGGITGTGDLTLRHNSTSSDTTGMRILASQVNITGAISNTGTSTGTAIIGNAISTTGAGGLSATVTSVTQDSATSSLQFLNANNSAYTGNYNINAGTLQFAGTNTGPGTGTNLGTITATNATSVINLGATTGTAAATLNIVNNAVSGKVNNNINVRAGSTGTKSMTLNSSVSFATTGTITLDDNLTVNPTSGGTFGFTFNGLIQDGTSGPKGLVKTGAGDVTLPLANTYSGATTVTTGNLILTGSAGALPNTSGITISGGTFRLNNTAAAANSTNRIPDSTVITMNGAGTLDFKNDAGADNFSETVAITAASAGTITASPAASGQTSTLTIGTFVRNPGSVLSFTGSNLGVDETNRIFFTTSPAVNGVIPWASYGTTGFASYDATNGVTETTSYTDIDVLGDTTAPVIPNDSASNIRILADGTGASNITLGATTTSINTLLQANNGTAPAVVETAGKTLRAHAVMLQAGTQALTIGTLVDDGFLTSATLGGELILFNHSATNALTLNAVIANNDSASSVSKAGAGNATFAGTNTYSGNTTLTGGIITAASNKAFGTGSVTINPTTTRLVINDDITLANDITFKGGGAGSRGVFENSGAGTATLSGAITIDGSLAGGGHFASIGGGTLNISGPITSTGFVSSRIGKVIFSGGGNYSNFIINEGSVKLGANNGLSTSATVDVALSAAGTLDLNGYNQSLVGITRTSGFTATIGNSSTATDSILTVTGTPTYAGNITNVVSPGTKLTTLNIANGANITLTGAYTANTPDIQSGGTLTIGAGGGDAINPSTKAILVPSGALLKYTGANRVQNDVVLTVESGGTFDENAQTDVIGYINGAGNITNLNGALIMNMPSVGSGSDFSGSISGSSTLSFTAAGTGASAASTQILSGANNLTNASPISVTGGRLIGRNTAAFGAAGKIITVGAAALTLDPTIEFGTDMPMNDYVINMGSGITGTIELNRATSGTAFTQTASTPTLGNSVLNIEKGANITTGTPVLQFPSISLSAGVTGLGAVTLNPIGVDISVTGGITRAGNNAANLKLDGTSTGNVIAGVIQNKDTTNKLNVTKQNTSTWTLSGINTYTGTTTVNGGTLHLTGSLAAGSAVTVGGAAATGSPTLTGVSGTVNGALTIAAAGAGVAGTVSPGTVGTTGTLNAGATTIAGTYACDVTASASDLLAVNGALTLTGATLAINAVAPAAASYIIATYTGTAPAFTTVTGLPSGYSLDYATPGEIKLVAASVGGYAGWASENNVTGGPEGDDDGDGIKNLMEYALGLDAKVPGGSPGTFSNNILSFTKGEGVTGVTYAIETSGTLNGDWAVVFTSPAEDATVSYTLPTGQGKIFARLKVTQP